MIQFNTESNLWIAWKFKAYFIEYIPPCECYLYFIVPFVSNYKTPMFKVPLVLKALQISILVTKSETMLKYSELAT